MTCPARTAPTERFGTYGAYEAKARFWEDTTAYKYPYCPTDTEYYN